MIYLTVSGLIAFGISLFLSKGDYLQPGVAYSGSMLVGIICMNYLAPIWNVKLNEITIILIGFSLILFVIISGLIVNLQDNKRTKLEIVPIDTNYIVDIFIILMCVITIFMHISFLKKLFGTQNLIILGNMYRYGLVYGTLDVSKPSSLSRLMRYTSNASYIYSYITVNNIVGGEKLKNNIRYIIIIFLYFVDTLLEGARGYIIYWLISTVIYIYFLTQYKTGWARSNSRKILKRVIVTVVIVLFIFIVAGNLMGRSSYGNPIYRISRYFGGGIALLDEFIKKGGEASPSFGAVTFSNFNIFIRRHFQKSNHSNIYEFMQFDFINKNGISWGNVYTSFRRYYQDFGLFGSYVCVLLLCIFFSLYCVHIKKTKIVKGVKMPLLVYGIVFRSLVLNTLDDEFFNDFVTPSFLLFLIEYYLMILIIEKSRLKKLLSRKKVNYWRMKSDVLKT